MSPHAEADTDSSHGDGLTTTNGFHESAGAAPTAAAAALFKVNSPNVVYTDEEILSKYTYRTTSVTQGEDGQFTATPREQEYNFKVDRRVPKVGLMLVGWGGNNGSTLTAAIIANRRGLSWETREGRQAANFFGSLMMASTMKLGTDAKTNQDVNIPLHTVLPMIHPSNMVIGGWDISKKTLSEALDRAGVLEPTLKAQVRKEMDYLQPLPSIYYPDFIAANQEDRADNLIAGSKASMEHVDKIRGDIR